MMLSSLTFAITFIVLGLAAAAFAVYLHDRQ